jgi:hypothetical protein
MTVFIAHPSVSNVCLSLILPGEWRRVDFFRSSLTVANIQSIIDSSAQEGNPMRFMLLCVLLFSPALAQAADLSKIDRTIKKEPAYKGKPKYGLLVFGSEAKTKLWIILDGTDLYVDKNGDGALTAEECFRQDGRELKEFDVAGGYKIRSIGVHRDKQDKRVFLMARVQVGDKFMQYCDLSLVENRQNAPVAHFDGPLKLGLRESNWVCTEKLVRDGKAHDLFIWVGTFDKANGCWVVLSNTVINRENFHRKDFPTDIHPIAEIEFPAGRPGDEPLRQKYEMKERC